MPARLLILVLLSFLAAAAAPPASQEVDRPVSLPEAKARGSLQSLNDLAGLPVINVKSIDEVLKLSLKDKNIVLRTSIAPTEQSLVRIPHFPGVSHVKLFGVVEEGSPVNILRYDFENRDYTIPNAICRYTTASLVAGTVTLTQMIETLDDQLHSVQLLQHAFPPGGDEESPRVSLYVQVEAEPKVNLQLTAANVLELRRKHPGAVAKYVDPIFHALRQEALLARVNPRLAWQVFADISTPPPSLVEQVNKLVTQLDAQSFRDREAASQQLESLGQPAALVLMRLPRQGLSDEQNTRIDAFLAKYKPESEEQAKKLRSDKDFLLDCLSSEEEAIRAAAFAELRRVTGQSIEFDLNADAGARATAIAALRETIGTPTTRQLKE